MNLLKMLGQEIYLNTKLELNSWMTIDVHVLSIMTISTWLTVIITV